MSDPSPTLPGAGSGVPPPSAIPPTIEPTPGDRPAVDAIGQYKLLRVLGEGGLGVVYLAERRHPIVQKVAVKVIKPGMDSRAVLARFEAERQALALMDHPNIAKVLDAGATAQGYPYFVMEYIQGEPITAYCDRHQLTIAQRLALFVQVCAAIQHAHTKGVIHRDIKPSNVLVAHGSAGAPGGGGGGGARTSAGLNLGVTGFPDVAGATAKVIDFGVAKAMAQPLTERTLVTEMGQLIGTPEYMSPEQAEMSQLDIDTRSDVYSLGVLLYELLTGVLPFESRSLRSGSVANIQRTIRELEPPTPSTRLSTLIASSIPRTGGGQPGMAPAASEALGGDARTSISAIAHARRTDAESLRKTLRSELEWIPLKAMRKARAERYQSPSELAADVLNYLTGKPLVAAPESTLYRFRKWITRNRAAAGVILGFFAVLSAATIVTSIAFVRANEQRAEAARERDRARAAEADALVVLAAMAGDPEAGIEQIDASIAIRKDLGQPETPELAYSLYLKASFLTSLGDMDETEESDREPTEAEVAARAAKAKARTTEAEALLRQSLEMAQRLLASGQTTTALARLTGNKKKLKSDVTSVKATAVSASMDLAMMYQEAGRHKDVSAMYRTRLALIDRNDLDDDAYALGYTLRSLAVSLVHEGDFAEAARTAREALDNMVQPPETKPDPWSVCAFRNELAEAYVAQQRYKDAEGHLLASWELASKPENDLYTMKQAAALLLADVYEAMGQRDKAEEFKAHVAPAAVQTDQGRGGAFVPEYGKDFVPIFSMECVPRPLIPPPFWRVFAPTVWEWVLLERVHVKKSGAPKRTPPPAGDADG